MSATNGIRRGIASFALLAAGAAFPLATPRAGAYRFALAQGTAQTRSRRVRLALGR